MFHLIFQFIILCFCFISTTRQSSLGKANKEHLNINLCENSIERDGIGTPFDMILSRSTEHLGEQPA